MKIGLVGSGGREHALALALTRNPEHDRLVVFGSSLNPGLLRMAEKVEIGRMNDAAAIDAFMRAEKVDLVVVGPEAPLMTGVVDALRKGGLPTVGPVQVQARLEGDKGFMRDILQRNLPWGSPQWQVVRSAGEARAFIEQTGPVAVKPLGLTGGKGVRVMGVHLADAEAAVQDAHGWIERDGSVLLEERLVGEEFSRMAFVSGEQVIPMPVAQDFKYAYDGDRGGMTGGMGAYTTKSGGMPFLNEDDLRQADDILRRTVQAITAESGQPYRGFLYGQFMATASGVRVIEYNVRLGDPEGINLMLLLQSDAPRLLRNLADGRLEPQEARFLPQASLVKYLVPAGYPDRDDGPRQFALDERRVKQAGFRLICASAAQTDGAWQTLGSRTLALAGIGEDPAGLSERMEALLAEIEPPELRHRADVGSRSTIQMKIERMAALRSGAPLL
jgi:phosphoribosylamine--glycine ligase